MALATQPHSPRRLQDVTYILGSALVTGLVVWIVGVYRNPYFGETVMRFPRSMLLAVPLLALTFAYHQALRPEYVEGCIVDFLPVASPTPWHHADAKLSGRHGDTFLAGMTVGYASPDVVGRCGRVARYRTALLAGYRYRLMSTSTAGYDPLCPGQPRAP
ncbi:MAG: hypothetical protein JJU22_13370 [Gammaproteobacteria bacterium]|nr:hypothetical protein [Gammaproteobacteria bacterium]